MEKAMKFYDDKTIEDDFTDCLNPCTTFIPTLTVYKAYKIPQSQGLIEIAFPSQVKVITTYPTYTFLSLIAEVGGYVGLFLGVSILDLKRIINYIYEKV